MSSKYCQTFRVRIGHMLATSAFVMAGLENADLFVEVDPQATSPSFDKDQILTE
jgi:hypothetical protein